MRDEIKTISNKDKDFYRMMGPIFGSRTVETVTGDRFFDDETKTWYVHCRRGKTDLAVSVKRNVIKNVYAEDTVLLIEVLKELRSFVGKGIVPVIYEDAYEQAGYHVANRKKRFVTIVPEVTRDGESENN